MSWDFATVAADDEECIFEESGFDFTFFMKKHFLKRKNRRRLRTKKKKSFIRKRLTAISTENNNVKKVACNKIKIL